MKAEHIMGRSELDRLARCGAVVGVKIQSYLEWKNEGWIIEVRVPDLDHVGVSLHLPMTKSQSREVRVFSNLNGAYFEVRRFWSGPIEVVG
jgi:hypothetical protein